VANDDKKLFECPECGSADREETHEEYAKYTRTVINGVSSEKEYSEKRGDKVLQYRCLNCGEVIPMPDD
jgi:predicted RNA-binding Zn-ribbon protein involved in translation (DUF1610 family)